MNELLARRIGRKIAALRMAKGWSQEALAARADVARSRLSKWESGDHVPPVDKLIGLARELEVGLDDLVSEGMGPRETGLSPEQRRLVREAMSSLARLFPGPKEKETTG